MAPAAKGDERAVVPHPLARQPVAEPDLAKQIDRRLFEDAGTNALDDVRFAADLHGHRVDPGLVEQVSEEQARRPAPTMATAMRVSAISE